MYTCASEKQLLIKFKSHAIMMLPNDKGLHVVTRICFLCQYNQGQSFYDVILCYNCV